MAKGKQQKKIMKILLILSGIILFTGILIGFGNTIALLEHTNKIQNVYIDGTNVAGLVSIFGSIGSIFTCIICIFFTFFVIGAIWIVYGGILFIHFLWTQFTHMQFCLIVSLIISISIFFISIFQH